MSKNDQGIFTKLFSWVVSEEKETEKELELTYQLQVGEGDEIGRSFILTKEPVAICRRLPGDKRINDILIMDMEGTISTEQARITWDGKKEKHIINYVGGTKNPTIVDGTIISGPVYLEEGSRIVIGKNLLIYKKVSPSGISNEDIQEMASREQITKISEEEPKEKTFIDTTGMVTGYYLKLLSGLEEGREFILDKRIICIGKLTAEERRNWILIDSSSVSIDQATLKWMDKDRKYAILHSKEAFNLTLVNEEEVLDEEFTLLKDGDIIRIGNIKLQVIRDPILKASEIESEYKKISVSSEYPSQEEKEEEKELISSSEELEKTYEEEDCTIIDKTMALSRKDSHKLKVLDGPDTGLVFTITKAMLNDKIIIGKKGGPKKGIEISDDYLSDYYGSLTFEDKWICINLEDENKNLLINNISLKKKGLENGDLIKIGKTILEYSHNEEDPNKKNFIEVIEGVEKGKIFPLDKEIIHIGRKTKKEEHHKEIEISEKDRSVSRNHARIEKKNGEFYIINEKEINITLINGEQLIREKLLINGDKIKLGEELVLLFNKNEPPLILRDKIEDLENIKDDNPLEEAEEDIKDDTTNNPLETEEDIKDDITDNNPLEVPVKEDTEQIKDKISPEALNKDMVFIPGGIFLMGTDDMESDANPEHKVMVEPFYIDRYTVTNLQFADFIKQTGYNPEGEWKEYVKEGKEYYPAVGVTYNDALAFARWTGKRLPTESEWEKAARGTKGSLYPWGDGWDSLKLCSKEEKHTGIVSIDSYPEGASPYRVMNMLGNVWEWTGDHYLDYPYEAHPVTNPEKEVTIRGGDWQTELKSPGVTIRGLLFPEESGDTVGFRCAKSKNRE